MSRAADKANFRKGRSLRRSVVLWGLVAFAACSIFVFYATAPRPPAINLNGMDPVMTRAIRQARQRAWLLPRSGQAWGRLGMILEANGYNREAGPCYEQAARFDHEYPGWPYLRGAFILEEDPQRALPLLRRAAELTGGSGSMAPRLRLAELLVELGRLDEAAAQAQWALTRNPRDARALLAMGRLSFARGDMPSSRDYLLQSVSQQPTRAAYLLLAGVQYRLGESQAAERQSTLAAQLPEDASWPDPYHAAMSKFRLGLFGYLQKTKGLIKDGKVAETIELLNRVTSEYPTSKDAWRLLGDAYSQTNNLVAARQAYERALNAGGRPDAGLYFGLAGVSYKEGKFRVAADQLHEALRLDPGFGRAWLNLGHCFVASADWLHACEAFQNAVRFEPENAEAHRMLGETLARQGKTTEAIKLYEQAIQLNVNDVDAHYSLALTLAATGNSTGAVAHYAAALQLNPALTGALNNLAWIRATHPNPQLRDAAEAVRLAERVCQISGRKGMDYLDTLAAAYAEAQRFDEAVATAQEAVVLARSANQTTLADEILSRIALYRDHQPYRETPNKPQP